jgi:hypothetical protein
MRIHRVRLTLGRLMLAVAVTAVLIAVSSSMERRRRVHAAAQARYSAALRVYAEAERLFLGGETDHLPVYWQSRMLLEAQRDLGDAAAAARGHLKRMKKLQATLGPVCNSHAQSEAKLYVVEAEYWVLREGW